MTLAPPVPSPPDALVRTVSASGGVSVRAIVATALVQEAADRHALSPVATVALGRALMGAVLLGSSAKQDETVQIQIRGNGPLGPLLAISDQNGRARGYVSHPQSGLDAERLDVAEAVGSRGTLTVVRQGKNATPYSGIVPLQTGTVAEDIAHYLSESEQSRSAIGLGVFIDAAGRVTAAGGFAVHALPDADPNEVSAAEGNVRGFPGPGELVREGFDAAAITETLLLGIGLRERHTSKPAFHCGCTRERVLGAVSLLERDEIESSIEGGEPLEIICRFCADRYQLSPQDLSALLATR